MKCPRCGEECTRRESHNGQSISHDPFRCKCGWSEDDQYYNLPPLERLKERHNPEEAQWLASQLEEVVDDLTPDVYDEAEPEPGVLADAAECLRQMSTKLRGLEFLISMLPIDDSDPDRPRIMTRQHGWVDLHDYVLVYRDDWEEMAAAVDAARS